MGDKKDMRSIEKRALFFVFLVFVVFIAICAKLASIQVVNAEWIVEKASHLSERKKLLPAKRGEIMDRNREKLAITIEARKIVADPLQVENKEKAAKELSKLLGVDKEQILNKLYSNRRYVILAEEVPLELAIKVVSKNLGLIYLERDYRRIYPYGSLLCHALGFVQKKADEKTGGEKGGEGLEYVYNSLLSGKEGHIIAQVDRKGNIIPGTVREKISSFNGLNLVTTIDKEIQFVAERELENCIKEWEAKSGCVIVMDPKNGEILAMASYPAYNLNDFGKVKDSTYKLNRAIREVIEPGSTIKALTVAAILEEGLFAADSWLYLPEEIKIGGYTIGEAHHRPAGSYTVGDILIHSYNVGAVRLAERLGAERLYSYLLRFGISEKTGIDLGGEQRGFLPSPENWSKTTIANIPFGQGLSSTPLQVLRAVSSFANGGIMTRPHFLKYTFEAGNSTIHKWEPEPGVRVVSAQTSKVMTNLLEKAVSDGTGKEAQISGYSVAGKTGTAQKVNPNGKGYLKGHYISSFVGYAPASNPAFSMIVVIDDPRKGYYGGQVAGPAFRRIGEFVLKHMRIPPDKGETDIPKTKNIGES